MRLIDADVLRYKLLELASDDWNQMCRTFWANVYNECADMVDNQPSIELQKWIPCNERLPDETGLYIVTDKKERVTIRWYSIKFNFAELTDTEEVIAWMHLPEPWKEWNNEVE